MVLLTGEGKYCRKCKNKVVWKKELGYFCEECMSLTIPIDRFEMLNESHPIYSTLLNP
jgi:Zn finger protein HypA/HybF involved in hydrogenase expression